MTLQLQVHALFVLEARNQDGNKSILSGLNRILKESKAPFSIFDKSNPAFRGLQLTLDTVISNLHREGLYCHSSEHEDFWI